MMFSESRNDRHRRIGVTLFRYWSNSVPGRQIPEALEFVFHEQSYSSLHSGRSLAWDHCCGDIDDPCGVVAIPEAIGGRAVANAATPIVARLAKHHKTLLNIVKHHETHVKHCDTS